MSGILKLSTLRPEAALENLNRLTGLDFHQWPESLIDGPEDNKGRTSSTADLARGDGTPATMPWCQRG